jgi:hypothetical protein
MRTRLGLVALVLAACGPATEPVATTSVPTTEAPATTPSMRPGVRPYLSEGLEIQPHPVEHTSRPTFGYLIVAEGLRIAWAPEFMVFPDWAGGSDLMFAEAAGWDRPIRFAGGVGGHASALDGAEQAPMRGVRRLVFAHIGRPTLRALEAGKRLPFGVIGFDGAVYEPRRWRQTPPAASTPGPARGRPRDGVA